MDFALPELGDMTDFLTALELKGSIHAVQNLIFG